MLIKLPIDEKINDICKSVVENKIFILKASPGSGKTTRVPSALMSFFKGKIIVLEPRKLAAKFAASRISFERQTKLGTEVGYAFRFDHNYENSTRLLFYTEGTFLRSLLQNPTLEGIDVVILDEFHERHKETDVAWALLQKIQRTIRPDLHLVVMSATLDKNLFPSEASFLEMNLPQFLLTEHYLEHRPSALDGSLEKKVYEAMLEAYQCAGDILIFLSGMKDILSVKEALSSFCTKNEMDILILHGDLSNGEQARVMEEEGRRKVILSTNIAESSLTIPGVRIVIDSGFFRQSTFSPYTGLHQLETKKISKSSAIQRAGRAARTGEGHVFRLYSKHEFDERIPFEKPEILRTELSETLLLLGNLGETHFKELPWIEIPPQKAFDAGMQLLYKLGAFYVDETDAEGRKITEIGKKMARYPLHPRQSRLLVEASKYGAKKIKEVIEFISSFEDNLFLRKSLSSQLHSLTKNASDKKLENPDLPLECLLIKGFVDRIGYLKVSKARPEILLCEGETLTLSRELSKEIDPNHPLGLVLDVSSSKEVTRFLSIDEELLYEVEPFPIEEKRTFFWDEKRNELFLRVEERIGQILLSESKKAYKGEILDEKLEFLFKKMMREILQGKLALANQDEQYFRLQFFSIFLKKNLDEFDIVTWLNERLDLYTSLSEEQLLKFFEDYFTSLLHFIDPDSKISFTDFFPEKLFLRDKRILQIHYENGPWVEGFIQDFYGMTTTPTIAGGSIPLTLRLLGPHKRPLQTTKDLLSFWAKTYKELYGELSRDYPRHHWPTNPEAARPCLLKRHL